MPRRGMNIYKRKDGRWEGRVKKENSRNGARQYISFYGRTYAEVKKRMEDAKAGLTDYSMSEKCTLEEAVAIWRKEKAPYLKKTTQTTYNQMISKYILPELGNLDIFSINEEVLERFISNIREQGEISISYQRNICAVIIRVMKYMKKRHHCEIKLPENILPAGRLEERLLPGREELAVLEQYLIQEAEDSTCLGILTALYTGLRIGEVCALTWKDINLSEGTIHIHKNLQRVKSAGSNGQKNNTEILVQTPKSGNSRRMIPIPPVLLPLLAAWQQDDSFYLIRGKKKPWAEPRTLQYRFSRILKQCGLENFNFHMLRHAFATRCIAGGFDVKSLSEILGHSSIQITLNLYVHSNMQRKIQLMSQFDGCIYSHK